MADMKANMLLTMSAVVITLAAPHVFKPNYQWPFLILIIFCLITVGLAAYAVMPKLPFTSKNPDHATIDSPQFNLLFFGDFIHLDYQHYEAAMEKLMNDPSQAYEAQVREVYVLGQFLARQKYRYLRMAYLSFIAGLFASFIMMLVSAIVP